MICKESMTFIKATLGPISISADKLKSPMRIGNLQNCYITESWQLHISSDMLPPFTTMFTTPGKSHII